MLEVNHLSFDYNDKPLLQDVHFTVKPGQLLHLQGHNGAGKTTLLKLLAGLLHPAEGEIRYQHRLINDDLADYQQSMCYVGHKAGISQVLTVRENCQFELQRGPHCMPFEELINRFSLTGLEDVPCGLLSMGQRRRVGLMRILMSDVSLWLLDEPLVALDQDAVMILMDCFGQHLEKGRQIVLTSHQPLPLLDKDCLDYCL